eukprot:TRINITY_DN12724_c1_g1_i1.p2 TRINITY_DN12724_c1_g1~~TRINITY_DN12724_c1_g1_i1.p2  ORF type:complete len:229 (+),score=50.42 TRINITY_DN12724_c1_g1_i1:102-788(+)
MDPVFWLMNQVDPFLIAPYRWLADPVAGWWLGTALLCLWCTLLGEATLAVVHRFNREHIEREKRLMLEGQSKSWEAIQAGNKLAYKGFNEQANESFGKSFFMGVAMGSSSLWPAFLAMAWLTWRFGQVQVPLPLVGWKINFAAGFIPMYIAMRLLWALGKKRLRARPEPPAGTDHGNQSQGLENPITFALTNLCPGCYFWQQGLAGLPEAVSRLGDRRTVPPAVNLFC